MKGIITDYRQEKGFGFIKDENEIEYFFHISSVVNRSKLLDNLTDYFYTDYLERKCFAVDFITKENDKGLLATNIKLTKEIFNNKASKEAFEARITDVKYHVNSLTRITSGIRKGGNVPFGATAGGNGTYRLGYPEISKNLIVSFRRLREIGWGPIEVRELALQINNRSKMTDSFIEALKSKLVDQITTVNWDGRKWVLTDSSILKL